MTGIIPSGPGVDGRADLDRIVTVADRFGDFDDLCLQEVRTGYPEWQGGADA